MCSSNCTPNTASASDDALTCRYVADEKKKKKKNRHPRQTFHPSLAEPWPFAAAGKPIKWKQRCGFGHRLGLGLGSRPASRVVVVLRMPADAICETEDVYFSPKLRGWKRGGRFCAAK